MAANRIAMLVLGAVVSCGLAPVAAGEPDRAVDPGADRFNPIQRYDFAAEEPRGLAAFYLERFGARLKDAKVETLDHPDDATLRVALVTIDGIRDDAVKGLQWRFAMRSTEGRWEAVEAGMRRSCYRGENAGNWTRELCP